MKLRTKFTLLASALIIWILLIVDLLTYVLFVRLATRNEIDLLRNKSEQIVEAVGAAKMIMPGYHQQIYDNLPEDSAIRILSPDLHVLQVYQTEPDIDFAQIRLTFADGARLLDMNDGKLLVVRMPIRAGDRPIGVFEMSEKMESLETNMNLLVTILFATTTGAVLIAVAGASVLSRTLLKPLSDSVATMREIESSLAFKRIPGRNGSSDELNQMTGTFNRMMDRLEESFLKQQQFVSDASHELNTTIMIIEGYANMLRRWGDRDAGIRRESVEAIYEESKQMRKMTRQLLDLASAQQADRLAVEPFDLVACCRQACANAETLHGRDVDLRTDRPHIRMEADPTRIKQLLLILIDNAFKYSSRPIEVRLRIASSQAEISVKDYGVGIAEDDLHSVFERFYRADSSRSRKTGGTGLGLPIAQAIVQAHRGQIRIESEQGKGTEVTVHLPLQYQQPPRA